MAQTIKLRRSSSSGSIPTTSQLELGEVAINTYDGKMYIKKNVGGTESVIEVGASAAPVPGGSDGQIQFNNSGTMDGASFLYADDTNSRLGIGTTSPSTQLEVNGTITTTGLIAGTNEFPTTQGELGEVLTADGSGLVEWKLPQTLSYLVYNADSTTIAAGEPVYVFGANGTNISVKRALNTSDATCAQTLGLANESIASGSTGVIIGQGLLRGIDTTGYTAGQALYLGSTAGSITTTKPYAPNHLVYLGFVQTSASNGRIFVRTQNGYELDEIHDVQITSTPSDGDVLAYDSATSLWKPTADYAQLGEAQTWTANQTFADNAKAIFGAGSDLLIYHNGSQSIIEDQGTGGLLIKGSTNLQLRSSLDDVYINCVENAQVSLKYNNNTKLDTTSTGIDVTGTITADGLTVDGGNAIRLDAASTDDYLVITQEAAFAQLSANNSSTGSGALRFKTTTVGTAYNRMDIGSGGDISFYEDTGTTPKFFWDASAEALGIGTTSPSHEVHLVSASPVLQIEANTSAAPELRLVNTLRDYRFYVSGSDLVFRDATALSNRVTLTSSGNVGIGDSNPSRELSVQKSTDNCIISVTSGTAKIAGIVFGDTADDDRGYVNYNNTSEYLYFGVNASERMRIDSSGNVGINTSSPLVPLHVETSGTSTTMGDNAVATFRSKAAGRTITLQFSDGAITTAISSLSGSLGFLTNLTERMRIDSSGNVGIGTTSPNGKLDIKLAPTPSSTTVNETADFADKFVIGTNASGNFGDKIPLVFNVGNSTGDHISTAIVGEREASGWTSALSFWTNNQTSGTEGTDAIQEKMRITGAGYVGIGTTSPSQELHVVGTGYASTDFRAPIFYDSDNTAYYVNPASRSYLNGVSSVGLSTSWGTTSGVNTGALNAIMGTSTSATWLLSGTSGGTFRYGIQGLDSGGALRLYVGSNYLAFDGSTLSGTNLSGNATTATTLQTARTINGVSFNGSANINIGRLYSESGTTTNYLALSSTNELELFNSSGSVIDLYLNYSGGATSLKGPSGSTIWTSGNDGSGSGLDADLLDGQHGSYYTGYTDTAIANLIDTAPSTLDTLNELAAALGDDANFSTTVTNSIATKISKTGDTATGTHTFDDLRADGGNLILGDDAYSVSASYIGMKTSYQSGANDYMIISGTTDGNTYISAKDGSSVFIRGGGNYNNNQIEVPDTGAPTIAGSTIWHAGNDGTGSGLDADLLDGQEGSYYTNASNISSGTLSNSRLEDIFKAGTEIPTAANLNDYRTTGYYSQNANADAAAGSNYPVALAGILEVINDDTGNGAHTVQRYTRYNSPYTTYHRYYYNGSWGSWSTNWDSTNDGSGSGLDADLLDGQHGSYYYAASNPSGYTTNTGTVTSVAAGSYLTGGTITTTGTLAVDATSANTASKVVARDASGNFSAGTITAALSGNATTSSSTTGNAATATTLQTARTINGVSFNGSANIVVESYIEDDEATAATRYITFVDNTTAAYKRLNEDSSLTYNPSTNTVTAGTFSGALSGNATTATNVSGYSGTYWTSNNDGSGSGLDADLLDGQEGSYYAAASSLGSYLPLTGGTLTGALTGTTITTSGDINVGGGHVSTSTVQARVKFSVWSSTTYGIGMTSGISYGGIGAGTTEYALTNQMSDTAARGFWWGDSGHTNAQGAMALTTNGLLTVASGMRLGYGESDGIAPTSGQLSVNGTINATTSISAPIFYDSANTTYYVDPASTVYSAVLAGNVSIGGISKTSDTTVAVSAGDSNSAGFVAHGNAQGTAYFEWSQNSTRTYGGGIVYNGDGVPSFGAGEVTDRTTFYRIISGSKYKVFDYPYDNSIVTFYDEISVTNTCIAKNFDEGINSTTGVSGTSSLSPSGGSIREISLSGNVTFTSGFEYGESMTLMLTGGATYTVTWPTMTWLTPNGNVAPTLNGTKDLIIIWRGAYGNLYGAYAGYGA